MANQPQQPSKDETNMDQLFAELASRHEGYDVVDLRFLANQREVNGRSAAELDEEFASAIRNAVEIDATALR